MLLKSCCCSGDDAMGPKASGQATNNQKTAQLSGQVDRLDEAGRRTRRIGDPFLARNTPSVRVVIHLILPTGFTIDFILTLCSLRRLHQRKGINKFRRWLDGSVSGCRWARLARLAQGQEKKKEWVHELQELCRVVLERLWVSKSIFGLLGRGSEVSDWSNLPPLLTIGQLKSPSESTVGAKVHMRLLTEITVNFAAHLLALPISTITSFSRWGIDEL